MPSDHDGPRPPDAVPPPDPYGAVASALHEARWRAGLWRVARWTAAIVLTFLAVFFGIVPGIPGFPLFFLALFLIADDFPPARRLGVRTLRKFPRNGAAAAKERGA
jgi:hypothetical protein